MSKALDAWIVYYLLLGDLDGLVKDGPRDAFIARGRGEAALVPVVGVQAGGNQLHEGDRLDVNVVVWQRQT